MGGGSSAAVRGAGEGGAGAKRTFSSARRLAYFQFSSRVVGSPRALSSSMTLPLRSLLAVGILCAAVVNSSAMRWARVPLTSGSLFRDPVVSASLELEGETSIAASGNPAADQHVDPIRHDVLEQALIVRDEHDRALRRTQ